MSVVSGQLWTATSRSCSPLSHLAVRGAVAVLMALTIGTAIGGDEQADTPPARSSAAADDLPVLPRSREAAAGNLGDVPRPQILTTGGWASEAVGEDAKHQFDVLGEFLMGQGDAAAKLEQVVAADFTCTALRPSKLRSVYGDASLAVFRSDGEPAGAPLTQPSPPGRGQGEGVTRRGIEGCKEVLQELALPLDGSPHNHVHFKIVKVNVTDNTATTSAYFQAAGGHDSADAAPSPNPLPQGEGGVRGAKGRFLKVQQNAIWNCQWVREEQSAPWMLRSIETEGYEEIVSTSDEPKLFADCTEAVLGGNESYRRQLLHGVDHWRARVPADFGIAVTGYEGLALGDVNGDGLDDLYLCQPGGLPNRLFVRQADGTAVDESAKAGLDFLDQTAGALFVDLDNDGDQDLILAMDRAVVVLSNDGTGRFTVEWTMPTAARAFSLAAADYDNDGLLDFYVCVYADGSPYTHGSSAPVPWHDANNGGRNYLIRNEGDWKFRDVTAETGLDVNNQRFSFAASWEDYDDDGDMDLYVANDFGRNNLYRNDGGRFVDVAARAGVEDSSAGMSAAWADYNNDGRMDLYVGNMFSSAGNRITYQRRFKPGLQASVREEMQRHARGNSLFENAGDGTFRDVSQSAGVTMGRWAWSSNFIDFNNDGREDLYVANGFVTQQREVDL